MEPVSKTTGWNTCKCGKAARQGQYTCSECHAASMRGYRKAKNRLAIDDAAAWDSITQNNPITRAAYAEKCKGYWVVICGETDIAGRVFGFLPGMVLRVIDDKGNLHYPTLDRVVEDVARRLYGQPTTDPETQLCVSDAAGNQARVPAEILAKI